MLRKTHLDHSALSTSRGSNQGNMSTGFHREIEPSEDSNRGASGVTEMDISQLNSASDILQRTSLTRFRVDLWFSIEEFDDILRGTLRLGHIRSEREYISGLGARVGISGCKISEVVSAYPPKVTLMRTTKNWKILYSKSATSRAPYQNTCSRDQEPTRLRYKNRHSQVRSQGRRWTAYSRTRTSA